MLGETNEETRKNKYGAVRSRDHFKAAQHLQRMRGLSTPRMPAESDIAECSDAPLPPPLFFSSPLVQFRAGSVAIEQCPFG